LNADLLVVVQERWRDMFAALAAGEDLPPAQRLRTEGMMEAAVLLGLAPQDEVDGAMDSCFREAFGESLSQRFGPDWREFYPYPQIPAFAARAPVYPSAPD
jgi:hypothetical protein